MLCAGAPIRVYKIAEISLYAGFEIMVAQTTGDITGSNQELDGFADVACFIVDRDIGQGQR